MLRGDAPVWARLHDFSTIASRVPPEPAGILGYMDFIRPAAKTLVAFVVLLFAVARPVASQTPMPATAHSSWFAPQLVIDKDPICVRLLPVVRQKFATDAWRYVWNDRNSPNEFGPLNFVPLESLPGEALANASELDNRYPSRYVEVHGKRLYLRSLTHPGCGGACERQSIQVADQPIPFSREARDELGVHIAATPAAIDWPLYEDDTGRYFALSDSDGEIQVFGITEPGAFGASCSISLAPLLRESSDPDVKAAVEAIDAIDLAADGISRGAGSCGSMATAGRLRAYRREALETALYRPWQLPVGSTLPTLDAWKSQGILEYEAYAALNEQLRRGVAEVAKFFVHENGWSREVAERVAADSLSAGVNTGLSIGDAGEGPSALEVRTRLAILEHRPLAEIRGITQSVADYDSGTDDGIASVAVEYPEALEDLLQRGANPNQANAFGKTPLMYAAQYDQVESARILLRHGANPNAQTINPSDDCNFTLNRFGVTPLHYAARYGSAEMIRLLVENGAATFAQSNGGIEGPYPRDWLSRFSQDFTGERGPKIREQLPALLELLKVPAGEERSSMARQLVLEAEKHYAGRRVEESYRALKKALYAEPGNLRAQRDLALVALRLGRLGEAAEAAMTTIRDDSSKVSKADAWFNMGLLCEREDRPVAYNGEYYCFESPLQLYLRSWNEKPIAARRSKIEATMSNVNAFYFQPCTISAYTYLFRVERDIDGQQRQHLYVRHPRTEVIDPGAISWQLVFADQAGHTRTTQDIRPRLVMRHDLGELAITEMMADYYVTWPVTINGQTCAQPKRAP